MAKKVIDIAIAVEIAIKAATDKLSANLIGNHTKSQIKKRTRVGKGVDNFAGKQTKLKIKDSTKIKRKKLKKQGKLSSTTTPSKANLTETGAMLDSLNYEYNSSESTVVIAVSPEQQYKVNDLEKQGHKFLNLTRGEFREIIEIMTRRIVRVLTRKLKGL